MPLLAAPDVISSERWRRGSLPDRPERRSAGALAKNQEWSEDADALERAIELACRAHCGQRYPSPEAEP